MAWIRLIRVKQWIKNLFLFIAPFFAGRILETEVLLQSVVGFFAFSFIASSVYILNDYFDVAKDKLHPQKMHRPLASGVISRQAAQAGIVVLFLLAFATGYWLGQNFMVVLGLYFVMNIAYTIKLKHVALVDITIIATGFLMRIFAGGFATDIPVSHWLVLVAFLLALFMAMAKRRDEYLILLQGTNTRKAIEGYNLQFIDISMVMIAGVTVVSYIMYTLSASVQMRMGSQYLYLTTFLVILGILRYLQQTIVFERSGSPTNLVLTDRFLQLILLLWVLSFGVLLYIK